MLNSALEQFQILPIFYFLSYRISLTNQALIIFLSCGLFIVLFILTFNLSNGYFIPSRFQVVLENLYIIVINIVYHNTGKEGIKFFPFIFCICIFILLSNIVGLVPYSFTTTSHLIITLTLSLSVFSGIIVVIFYKHGIKSFQLFLPKGTSLSLSFLLVPIEFVSFLFKPLSLGVRLFANLIAGHTLLKVIGGFSWAIIIQGGILFGLHIIPLFLLVLLMGLECGVGLIQTYVFLILLNIYFREGLYLH
jgi:ATP synthase subunit 6